MKTLIYLKDKTMQTRKFRVNDIFHAMNLARKIMVSDNNIDYMIITLSNDCVEVHHNDNEYIAVVMNVNGTGQRVFSAETSGRWDYQKQN